MGDYSLITARARYMLGRDGTHNFALMIEAHCHNASMHIPCCQPIRLLVTVIFKVEGVYDGPVLATHHYNLIEMLELFSGDARGPASIDMFLRWIYLSHA